jgi:two-component system, NtrC family, sensor kinase
MLRVLRTVSFRVFAGTLLLLLLAFTLFATSAIHFTTTELTRQAMADADRLADFMAASTRYSMLLNRKQDVYQMMRTMGQRPGVLGIRVYNKRGLITFSTDAAEHGRLVDPRAEACVVCHDSARPLEALSSPNRARVYRDASGERVVGVIHPVRNEASCSAGGCHLDPAERTVLGVLDVRMSLRSVDAAIEAARRRTLLGALAGFVLVALASWAFLRLTIRQPIAALTAGTEALARGELDHHIAVRGNDDLGTLADSFNVMTRSLRDAQ